ncbi:hypothetical protein Daesc_004191 [Daldinia eschscholtzii]|uniref:DUF7707 domain-containing protein n=1 Tax=Daldinia eschscholtzii TaxID=292717 RepID=A0AAX6MNK6_9PEZI
MISTRAAAVLLSAFSLVSAQANSNSTFKLDNPKSDVDIADRVAWCQGQQDSCGTLCGTPSQNTCQVDSLDFTCVCQGGNEPDMNLYMNTVPWFVCERLQSNCIKENENNAAGQKNCTSTYGDKCGKEDVSKHQGEGSVSTTTSSSSSAAPSGTATPAASSAAAPSSSSSEAAAVPTSIQYLGNGAAAVALGMFAYML